MNKTKERNRTVVLTTKYRLSIIRFIIRCNMILYVRFVMPLLYYIMCIQIICYDSILLCSLRYRLSVPISLQKLNWFAGLLNRRLMSLFSHTTKWPMPRIVIMVNMKYSYIYWPNDMSFATQSLMSSVRNHDNWNNRPEIDKQKPARTQKYLAKNRFNIIQLRKSMATNNLVVLFSMASKT